MRGLCVSAVVCGLAFVPGAPADGPPTPVGPAMDSSRDVRPILADKCYACHGPDETQRKAKIRLDIPGVAELAAWTSVARVILNLHETITRN